MAQTKPTKPTNLMPRHFADDGIKNNFSSAKIASGFSSNFDDVLQGDNLNYMIDSIGKELQYLSTVVDFIVDMPINKTIKVNANNNLEYVNLVEDASDKANISLSNLDATGQALINNKANVDLSNMEANQEAKNTIIAWGMPDWSRGINKAAKTTFTADKRGWLQATGYTGGGAVGLKINDAWVARAQADGADDTGAYACLVPVNVGDTYWSTNTILFIPCKGEI